MEYNEEYKKKLFTNILKASKYISERSNANYIVTSNYFINELSKREKIDKRIETINKLLKIKNG